MTGRPKTNPTAADARQALLTLARYFHQTPAMKADPGTVRDLNRPLHDVLTDWWNTITDQKPPVPRKPGRPPKQET